MSRHTSLVFCAPAARAIVATAIFSAFLAAASPAAAQRYEALEPTLAGPQAQLLLTKVTSALRDPAVGAAGLKDITDYFNKFYFPAMTSLDAEQLGLLVENRKRLFSQFINAPRVVPAAQKHLVDLTANAMRVIAKGNYHPAVRYNAVLTLGQLDQQPGVTGAGGRPPVPLSTATGELVGLLESDEFNNVRVTPAVKIGALIGLERHTRFGADPQLADRITAAALTVVSLETQPEDLTPAVYDWMRCQAARVLINQFAKGGLTPPVHDALVKLIGTSQMGLDDRCEVAEALSPTLYENVGQGVDLEAMIQALGQLATDVAEVEKKAAEEYQDEVLGTDGGGFGGFDGGGRGGFGGEGGYGGRDGGYGGGRGGGIDPTTLQPQGPHLERRRLLTRLLAVINAGSAVSAGATDELKQRLGALTTPMQDVADQASGDATEAELADYVVALEDEVKRVVEAWGEGQAPAGEDTAEEEPADEAAAEVAAAPEN
jgi:hypothetical protein